jgi:hypothetical protein
LADRELRATYPCLKSEWRELWDQKIDDKWVGEAIARREYAALFVDRGEVLWATRGSKPPVFSEILEKYEKSTGERIRPIDPAIGGWGKFIKNEISTPRMKKKPMHLVEEDKPVDSGPQKKGGRGWLHSVK